MRRDLELIVGEKNVSSSESVLAQHGQDEGPHKGCNEQKYNLLNLNAIVKSHIQPDNNY